VFTNNNKIETTKLEKKILHYTGKAIADFKMIEPGDRILVCLSGGKDSFTMLSMLNLLNIRSKKKFEIHVFTLKQKDAIWSDVELKEFLENAGFPYTIVTKDIYSIVKEKIKSGYSHCSLCSRLRRGAIYSYAKEQGYNKIALGHHRDDLIQTLLMSICYSGAVRSMPPKLLTDDKKHIVIRPLAYCQEKDIARYAKLMHYPVVTCNMYCAERGAKRESIGNLIETLAKENPKVPSNILHAISNIHPSQLMDHNLWNFKGLEIQE
jgi:tRNA 2-thiocytidine biosynthesis protein TtcA